MRSPMRSMTASSSASISVTRLPTTRVAAAGALLGVQIAAFALVACAALVTPSGHGPVAAKPAAA